MTDDGFAIVLVSLLLGVLGIVIGFRIGGDLAHNVTNRKDYWKYNLIAYLVGILVSAVIWAAGWVVLSFVAIGALGGCIAGLKFGYGESVGPWKAHDRFMRVNGSHLSRAELKERRRGAKGGDDPDDQDDPEERELISVADPAGETDHRTQDPHAR